ncbi:conjugal transfer protein [Streptomyces sp. NPDC004296]|uniref:conjugal transfer protein n=1 Tax=Streptomyces sp. NPDC004296 TaxID=3364697 RepID=UPI0036868981
MRLRKHKPSPDDVVDEFVPAYGADSGWATVSTGAVANWTAVVRWGAWALVLAGPLLGGWALASAARPAAAPVRAEAPRTVTSSADAVAPAGFAELYVAAYLNAGSGDAAVEEVASYYPPARGMSWETGTGQVASARSAYAVQVRQVAAGYWSVTVAARLNGPAKDAAPVRYFQVPVRAVGKAGAAQWVAAALPAEVAAPTARAGSAPNLAYGPAHAPASSDPAAQTVEGFLGAYLAGRGDVERYLSPGAMVHAIRPAPYSSVTLTQISEHGPGPAEGAAAQVPPDGVERHLLVDVVGQRPGAGGLPMTYALELRSRGGRWEVAALEAAPALTSLPPRTEGRTS